LAATIAGIVPELPDLTVVTEAFHAALAGRDVVRVSAPGPLAVRGTPEELGGLVGQVLRSVTRRGKFVRFQFDPDAVVVNAMLTGRFQLAAPTTKVPAKTAFVVAFGPRERGPLDAPAWTRAASWLPANGDEVEVRYRDQTQMGKVYVLPAGQPRAVPGYDGGTGTETGELQGPDADDPVLTLEVWRERIRRHPGELKALLRNQAFVAGIGNAYSDEILHAARLNPFRRRSSLATEEVDALYAAMRSTLSSATATLRERVPPTFETEIRDFLAVHRRGGQPCPRCGARISEVSSRSEATSWCRGCQP
jgi:formamidopyrimidine-DNA glycosylase